MSLLSFVGTLCATSHKAFLGFHMSSHIFATLTQTYTSAGVLGSQPLLLATSKLFYFIVLGVVCNRILGLSVMLFYPQSTPYNVIYLEKSQSFSGTRRCFLLRKQWIQILHLAGRTRLAWLRIRLRWPGTWINAVADPHFRPTSHFLLRFLFHSLQIVCLGLLMTT